MRNEFVNLVENTINEEAKSVSIINENSKNLEDVLGRGVLKIKNLKLNI